MAMGVLTVAGWLGEFAKAVIVPAITAGFTAYLALGSHRRERWWEKKYEAYAAVLLALHRVKRSFGEDYERAIIGADPTEEQKNKSLKLYMAGVDDVTQYADIGGFILSETACEVIKEYGRDVLKRSKERTYEDYLDHGVWAADKALKAMTAAAKSDLLTRGKVSILRPRPGEVRHP